MSEQSTWREAGKPFDGTGVQQLSHEHKHLKGPEEKPPPQKKEVQLRG